MKKYALISSILLNIFLICFIVGKHYYMAYKFSKQFSKDVSNDSLVTYTYNKFKVFKLREDFFKLTPIQQNDIVFAGNSLVQNFPITEMLGKLKNRGMSGDNTTDLLSRIDPIISGNPTKIFLMEGINDIGQKIPEEKTFRNIADILKKIKKQSPGTEIYVHSILPVTDTTMIPLIKQYNKKLKALAIQNKAQYIDLFPLFFNGTNMKPDLTFDGVHLTPKGYVIWRDAVKLYVNI